MHMLPTRTKKSLSLVASATALGVGLAVSLPASASASSSSYQVSCWASAELVGLGTAEATSNCAPVGGPPMPQLKRVSKHRAVIKCSMIRGTGASTHDIPVTLNGPWKTPGQKSKIKCPIRSSLAGYWQQTKK
ncbi:hypothetical protein [Streptomyces sp. NPDC046887]|uniref:hypothetical protein n=1 Tax=Streptomyces sp. NPDC046887 TaxID=3155472 RepID=UPI0034118C36